MGKYTIGDPMAVCQIEEINKGGAYPKSCPRCGLGGKCQLGLSHPFDKSYAVIYDHTYTMDDTYGGWSTETVPTIKKFDSKQDILAWLASYEGSRASNIEVLEYKKLAVKTSVEIE